MSKLFFIAAALLALVAAPLRAAVPSVEIQVEIQYPNQSIPMILLGMDDGEFVFRPRGHDIGGRAYLMVEDFRERRVGVNVVFSEAYDEAVRLLRTGRHRESIRLFRESIEPIFPFIEAGMTEGNLLPAVDQWIEAMITAERWSDAVDVIRRLPLHALRERPFARVVDLATTLYREERYDALEVLNRALSNVENPSAMQRRQLMRLGHFWREARSFREADGIYGRVATGGDAVADEARQWQRFVRLLQGILDEETPRERRVGEPGFTLSLLIEAHRNLLRDDVPNAMRKAAESFVYSGSDEVAYAEILLTLGELYLKLEDPTVAARIFRQGKNLYQETLWAERFEHALQTIIPPTS